MNQVLTDSEDKKFPRIKWGDEVDFFFVAENEPCGDCGAPWGELHREKCDEDQCPKCGGQFISCDCIFVEQKEKWSLWTGRKYRTNLTRGNNYAS